MKTITAYEFFREGAYKKHLARENVLFVTTSAGLDFYVVRAQPRMVKTIDEIKAENETIFGEKPKTRCDSVKLLRRLRK